MENRGTKIHVRHQPSAVNHLRYMNKILLIAVILSLASCASSQEEKTTTTPAPVEAATQSAKTPQKTTTAAKRKPMMSTARQAKDIEANYPYDIDFKTADGKIVKSSEVLAKNDKPTVLLFWLTTCVPCRYEMKAIQDKYAAWEKEADFNLYAISTDFEKNYPSFVSTVQKQQWPWEAYNDMNREFRNIMPGQLNGLPQTFVIGTDGKIVYHKRKWKPGDEDKMFEVVKGLSKG